jgi:hypothetical protein
VTRELSVSLLRFRAPLQGFHLANGDLAGVFWPTALLVPMILIGHQTLYGVPFRCAARASFA